MKDAPHCDSRTGLKSLASRKERLGWLSSLKIALLQLVQVIFGGMLEALKFPTKFKRLEIVIVPYVVWILSRS